MHEVSSNANKVNKAVAKVRTIGDRLPLNNGFDLLYEMHCTDNFNALSNVSSF